ncbi:EAL domain-containing protein [Oceanispirochaeta sp.]|jgi:diguanylate cyclase (GGDEF)-like protein/PAS domain S-box-containing protein|uniref:putative bifunctional diguanylate cyclase/phosphodiesterase n=1 Tax=Oceanispirochaeta sp. TaxID=2035350 RepID=UPI00262E7CDD|nr:EAL domain-containing protein [Oceanispirochaeta sp.]MDA3957363.1 EAL domain-containing protein [Oceanispirochaeta sp.]
MVKDSFISKSRTDLLFNNLPSAITANFLVSSVLIFVFRNSDFLNRVLFYVILIWIVNIGRIILYLLARRRIINKYSSMGNILYIAGLVFSSGLWGLLTLILLPVIDSATGLFLSILLVGFATGGMINLTANFYLAMLYLQMILLPLIGATFFHHDQFYLEILVTLLFYDAFLIFLVSSLSGQISQNLRLKLKNLMNQEKIRLNEQRFEAIFKEAPIGILYYDKDLVIQNCNESFSGILKTTTDKLIGLSMHNLHDQRVVPALTSILKKETGSYEGPYHTLNSDIDIVCSLKTSPVIGSEGELIGGVCILEDNTEKEGILNKIEYQAFHDSLTDLPNRQLLIDRLKQAVKAAHRHHHRGAILFLDLDKFKLVNDTMGHRVGDLLLQEVALRLIKLLREEDTIARLGGDEFVILLPNLTGSANETVVFTNLVSNKIHETLAETIVIENYNIQISTSIGVYIFSKENHSADHILKSADTAMYNAKETGRSRTSFYHSSMDESMLNQLVLEQELASAINNDELEMFYQPIVSLENQKIVAAEALLRWDHKERGFISPESIIQTAESSGQIVALGDWIINRVFSDYNRWFEDGSPALEYVSINISIKQIMQADFVKNMKIKMNETHIPHENIVLEITESILISDFKNTVKKIMELQDFGVQFALDDFGTGYSSLSYLKRLPLNKLKIDRFFTCNLLTDHDDYILIKTILSIAQHFNLDVIAEGVEEKSQVDKLRSMGCFYYQGYFCSKPVPPKEFLLLFEDQSRGSAAVSVPLSANDL